MAVFDKDPAPSVVIKDTLPMTVAVVKSTGTFDKISVVFMDLFKNVLVGGGKVTSYPMVLFPVSSGGEPANGVPFEVCIPVDSDNGLKAVDLVEIKQLPAVTVASARHHGDVRDVGRTYAAVLEWISDNGYLARGPSRELYITNPLQTDADKLVTEIQVPVKEK